MVLRAAPSRTTQEGEKGQPRLGQSRWHPLAVWQTRSNRLQCRAASAGKEMAGGDGGGGAGTKPIRMKIPARRTQEEYDGESEGEEEE